MPQLENKIIIDQLTNLYAKGYLTRKQFDLGVVHVLSNYENITVNNYTLCRGPEILTGTGKRPTVKFNIPEQRGCCVKCGGIGGYVAGKSILYCCGYIYRINKIEKEVKQS